MHEFNYLKARKMPVWKSAAVTAVVLAIVLQQAFIVLAAGRKTTKIGDEALPGTQV